VPIAAKSVRLRRPCREERASGLFVPNSSMLIRPYRVCRGDEGNEPPAPFQVAVLSTDGIVAIELVEGTAPVVASLIAAKPSEQF
jgi:hypothetical protein